MGTATPLRAIARAEFQRGWRLSLAVTFMLLLYLGYLMAWEASLREELAAKFPNLQNGFAMYRGQRIIEESYFVPIVLVIALACGVLGTYESMRGLGLALPTRYLTLPVRPAVLVLVQFACRLLLLLPMACVVPMLVATLGISDDYAAIAWPLGMLIGTAGPLAAAMWQQRLGHWSYWLWVAAPTALWLAGTFDYLLTRDTPTVPHAVIIVLVGLLSGCWLLTRGAGLETLDLSRIPVRILNRNSATPTFSSASAALRWSVRPRHLGWLIPASAVAALFPTAYVMRIESALYMDYQWLPWTPTWVIVMAFAQAATVRWVHFFLEFFPVALGIAGAFSGIQFLRANVLRRPIHLRLPMGTLAIAWNAACSTLLELTRVAFMGAVIFFGIYTVVAQPNVGAQYIWPEAEGGAMVAYLDTNYGLPWNLYFREEASPEIAEYMRTNHAWDTTGRYYHQEPFLESIIREYRLGVFVALVGIGWTAFWQALWFVLPFTWETGFELPFLSLALLWFARVYGSEGKQRHARICKAAALLLTLLYLVAIDGDIVMYPLLMLGAIWMACGRVRAGKRYQALACVAMAFLLVIPYVYELDGDYLSTAQAWINSPARSIFLTVGLVFVPATLFAAATRVLRHG